MVMNGTSAQEHRSKDAIRRARLARMLRSTSQKYPQGRLLLMRDGFGASLGDGRYLKVRCSGEWTARDLRDFLALFATWLVADPERIMPDQ